MQSAATPEMPLATRPRIARLPAGVVNQIAAGEVVERPASVVKELMENALDAGATRIDVSVEQGGSRLVRVVDNGGGIEPDELPLAVSSHATSKIVSAEDLFRVGTLGFRGEALASIAEVSRLTINSRTADSHQGASLEVVAGRAGEVTPCGCPVGTAVEVLDLFCNTPVRRKFLKGVQTELGHVVEAFTRLALARPSVHFTLRHGDRLLHDLPASQTWPERIASFFGQDLATALIAVESREGDVALSGYVAHPSHNRPHPRMQYLFLNGRTIRDRSLQHALGEAYRGLLLTGRYPIAFLAIDLPPEAVDVNVHPTKLEVRFQDGGRLYSQLLGTLRTRFLTTDLNTQLEPAAASVDEPSAAAAHDAASAVQWRQELVRWAQGNALPAGTTTPDGFPGAEQGSAPLERRPLELVRLSRPVPLPTTPSTAPPLSTPSGPPSATAPASAAATGHPSLPERAVKALQVHDRYLVAESDDGIVVIDQHALHERILYEQLREKVLAGSVESQARLVPEPVDLAPAEAAALLADASLLSRLGLAIDPFGGNTMLVTSYPAMLANLAPADLLRAVVDRLLAGGRAPDPRDLLDELLHMIACKAAIKAGDRLSPEEVAALVEQRHLARDSHHCPHGRPTALVFTRENLDRQFQRT